MELNALASLRLFMKYKSRYNALLPYTWKSYRQYHVYNLNVTEIGDFGPFRNIQSIII